jgi:hypothetical protein
LNLPPTQNRATHQFKPILKENNNEMEGAHDRARPPGITAAIKLSGFPDG